MSAEIPVALAFIDCINRCDLDGLTALMSEEHRLEVFDEVPVIGRASNAAAWRGYMTAFPDYRIHVHQLESTGEAVAVLGHTTGSHLRLPDEEERKLLVIWLVHVKNEAVERWRLLEDTPANRKLVGLNAP